MMAEAGADAIAARLGLAPHPEGGRYREVYRSTATVAEGDRIRSAITAIDYLLADGEQSRWHVVQSDEIWHFQEGDPLELITFAPGDPAAICTVLGPLARSEAVRTHAVPAGCWQAARPLGAFSLVSCVVGPGFDFADFAFVADIEACETAIQGPLAPWRELL